MSFHNQEFWMAKSTGCLNDGEMTYDSSSRMESKRSHQWFMDGPEVDVFPNKKQAVEIPSNNLLSVFSSNISAWGNSSSFHSFNGNFTERLLDPDAATRTMSYENRNIPSPSADKLNVARKDDAEPFGSDSLFGLSISHTIDDPGSGLNYGGIRKVKVSEVKESENVMSVPTDHAYDRGVNNTMSNSHAYKEVANPISTSLTYSKGEDNIVSMDDTYGRMYNNFISLCQSYNKGNDSLSVGQNYKEICNTISMDQAFSKEDNNMISIAQAYNKVDDNSFSRDSIFNKGEDDTISVGHTYHKGGNDKLLVAHSYNRGESTIISFGGCDDDDTTSSVRLMSSYELLMGQPPIQNSEAINERELVISNSDSLLTTALTSVSGHINVSKTKEDPKMSKKVPSNNFPSNVRSLLSTGMLDGVPVKYMAWSREKELRGVIKGAGYLCSCQSCNYAKVINAYEFERHAGRKTKHPNNHIYFENGKTIYGIVQELRSTPQNMLFEVIQTITGSPINQKSFRIWKESFLAATRELQRIYGNDEVKQLS